MAIQAADCCAMNAVRCLDGVDISEIAKRHDPAEQVILARENPVRGVPPHHPGRDAVQLRTHGHSVPLQHG